MKPQKDKNSVIDKWGEVSCSLGWVAVPTLLLFSQKELKITASELNVLMNLIVHWWEKSEKPFPSQAAIAYRTGLSVKTIQRALSNLEKKGLIIKISTPRSNVVTKGKNLYDLSPLIEELDRVSPKILESMISRKKRMVIYNAK